MNSDGSIEDAARPPIPRGPQELKAWGGHRLIRGRTVVGRDAQLVQLVWTSKDGVKCEMHRRHVAWLVVVVIMRSSLPETVL